MYEIIIMQVFFWKRSPCKCICIKGSLTNNYLFIASYALRVFSSNLTSKRGVLFLQADRKSDFKSVAAHWIIQ